MLRELLTGLIAALEDPELVSARIAIAAAGAFQPNISICPEAGKKFGPLTDVNWSITAGTGADLPYIRGSGVFRSAQTVASMTTCGVASDVSGIPPAVGMLFIETGALGGSDSAQLYCGLHLGVPPNAITQCPHGFYPTVSGVQHIITPPSGGGVVANCNTAIPSPTAGIRLALVRWDDTRLSWFKQSTPDGTRMTEVMLIAAPAISGLTLYPSCQLFSRGSGLACAKISLLSNA